MKLRVLGSAAGGGLPQWNCNCTNCRDVRAGHPALRPRTQSSLAATADGRRWLLINASPDLRQQLAASPELAPAPTGPARASPIAAVVLTNGDVDHVAGLLSLREGQPFELHATPRVLAALAANPLLRVLAADMVQRLAIAESAAFTPAGGDPEPLGLAVEAFPVPGKIALYLEDPTRGPGLGSAEGDTIGLELRAVGGRKRVCYVPGCAAVDASLLNRLAGADVVLFDGTLYTDDEMIRAGLSSKTGRRMGHISMAGAEGAMAALAELDIGRRIFVHINNSNPALREDGPEHRAVVAAGWEIAFDGMEIEL